MIFIISHLPQIKYTLPVDYTIIRSDLTGLDECWKDLRGFRTILSMQDYIKDDVICNFQYRRYFNCFEIPDGYDAVGDCYELGIIPIYQFTMHHGSTDICICEEIVNDSSFTAWLYSPQFNMSLDSMTMMKKGRWIEYATWMFNILDKWFTHPEREEAGNGPFLAERLTAYYLSQMKTYKAKRIEFPK